MMGKNQMRFLWAFGLSMAILSTSSARAGDTQERVVSLHLRYDDVAGELNVVSQRVIENGSIQQHRAGPQPGELVLRFEDSSGGILFERVIPDPRIVYYDRVDENMKLTGGQFQQDQAEFSVFAPLNKAYAKAELLQPDFSPEGETLQSLKTLAATTFAIKPAPASSDRLSSWDSETVVDNGDPDKRIDIVVVGDGYTAAEMDKYREEVRAIIVDLFFEQTPFKEYRDYFNIHRVDVISNESGADHPNFDPPVFVDTALDGTYVCSDVGNICVDPQKARDAALDAPAPFDYVFAMINDGGLAGRGQGFLMTFGTKAWHGDDQYSPFAADVALHETGHILGNLGDEYILFPGEAYPAPTEPTRVNYTIQTERQRVKWNHWIDPLTPLPTATTEDGVPGLYEGALYEFDIFRPTYCSKMNNCVDNRFEQINTEQLVKRIYAGVVPIDGIVPVESAIVAVPNQEFRVDVLQPTDHALEITWLLDGQPVGTGSAFTLDTHDLAAGEYGVKAIVRDTTGLVRYDPDSLLSASHTWTVTIDPATSVAEAGGQQPAAFSLAQNYPNPFNPATTIGFAVPKTSNVIIQVYDLLGRVVATPVNKKYEAGMHEVDFDATELSAGLYIYRIQAEGFTQSRKLILLK